MNDRSRLGAVMRQSTHAAVQYENGSPRGIIGEEVAAGNIVVSPSGSVKVADFGIAKSSNDTTELTVHGSFVGTATYASASSTRHCTVAAAYRAAGLL